MDMGKWNFMDDEDIQSSRKGKSDQSKVFLTSLRADTPQVYYFLTKPGEWAGDWINYRELNTRDGLQVGPELPSDLAYGVMVQDYKFVTNDLTGRRDYEYDNGLDPITAGSPGNQMWAVGAKNTDPKTGLVRVQWRCAVNVIDAITGYHKILKMSLTAKEDLKKYFAVKDEDGDFDITGRPYEILYTGEGFNWNVAIRPVRPGSSVMRDGKSVEVPAHPELGSAIDVREVLIEQREELDALLASIPTRSGQPIDTGIETREMPEWAKEPVDAQIDDGQGSGMDVFSGPAIQPTLTEKYLAMSPARLRSLLAKAKVDVERGAPKEQLAALAEQHNL
jgi:hypothetical protein